ncbi:chitin binding peritrophin-A domain-containing protein [Nocardia ninae]|uniref:chitin binding peritrophin-A domain-containing protein n=1 Tax=Nocardia ninae TaxID=356145 RepID=UPI0035316333
MFVGQLRSLTAVRSGRRPRHVDRDVGADPTRFHRCSNIDGELVRPDYQCSPGTVYHPELQACVHPGEVPPDHPGYSVRPS